MSGIAGIKANKQAVLSNQTSLDATKVGLRVGTRTEIDVLNAQQALASAQKSYYQSRYTYLDSLLALKQDAGYLTDADVASQRALIRRLPELRQAPVIGEEISPRRRQRRCRAALLRQRRLPPDRARRRRRLSSSRSSKPGGARTAPALGAGRG